jgi:hypothetical protein
MDNVLNFVAMILISVWLIGYVGFTTINPLVHIFLVLAVIVILIRIASERRVY